MAAGLPAIILAPKRLRLELLQVKAELERSLGEWVLNCTDCGREVHWVHVAWAQFANQTGALDGMVYRYFEDGGRTWSWPDC